MRQVILSTALSLDGCIDDVSPHRLMISSEQDCAAVEALRATCHAIVVGAGAIRKDNPSLVTKSDGFRQERIAAGLPPDPIKVTLTTSGDLDPTATFFATGNGEKLVYCPAASAGRVRGRLEAVATVIVLEEISAALLIEDMNHRGLDIIIVEGGSSIIKLFLQEDRIDRLRLGLTPFIVGDATAARFIAPGQYPMGPGNPFHPVGSHILGNTVVIELERRATNNG